MHAEVIKLYEDRNDVTLTTYVLDDSTELLNGKKRPSILICPGGAYFYCSDREGEAVALRFAAMGYHAFVLRYSNYSGNKGFPDLGEKLEVNPNSVHPAPMRDIGKAILTIKSHADEWFIDEDRIALCGFSAGAHNAAMYAVNWDNPVIHEYFDESPEKCKVQAAILAYGLSDYELMKQLTKDSANQDFFENSNIAILGEPSPSEEKLKELSPAMHVNENTPPMFLWATAEDDLVPVQHTLVMANALANKNIPFEVHVYEEGAHGLSLATQASALSKTQVNRDVAGWINHAESWLEKRFALPLADYAPWESPDQ